MTGSKPPKKLHAGLRPLWVLLHQAADAAPTRQSLADRLGISTSTLQRLLVSGDVPSFRSGATTREIRSWARTLTRLAVHFGREPRAWIEAAGITWDDEIAAISQAARDEFRRRARSRKRRGAGPGPAEWLAPHEADVTIQVGIAERGRLSDVLPGIGTSFLEAFTRRIALAIEPSATLTFETVEATQLLSSLHAARPRLHVAAGVLDTVRDRRRGVAFIDIPGFRWPLAAARIGRSAPRTIPAPRLSWESVLELGPSAGVRPAVVRGSVAELFLRANGTCRDDRLVLLDDGHGGGLLQAFAAAVDEHPEAHIVLVAEQDVVHRLSVAAQDAAGPLTVDLIVEGREHAPAYPLALGLTPGAGEWYELFRLAHDRELFGSAARMTGRLYATFLAAEAFEMARPGGVEGPMPPRRLEPFEGAGDAFLEALCQHFVDVLVSAPPVRIPLEESPPLALESPVIARRTALSRAASLFPEAWMPRLERVLGDINPDEIGLCHSCSATLPHHLGASDRFCRFCSDEHGTLRPRPEVQRLLAGWFRYWERELSPDDAMNAASRFMAAMPAWSRN